MVPILFFFVTTTMYLQAASRQFQGVLADHQHQEDQDDPEDPYTENGTNMSTRTLTETCIHTFKSLCGTNKMYTHPLTRISRTAWWTRRTWGSRETLFQAKTQFFRA